MNEDLKQQIAEALKDQQDVFGDDLLGHLSPIPRRIEEPKIEYQAQQKVTLETKTPEVMSEDFMTSNNLEDLYDKIHTCKRCSLGETRIKFVFGAGNPNADAMLIGEAPGADEDKQGEPFVGRAGKLLNDILKAIDFKREDVYIANILKCRPPNNRDPLPEEMEICQKYLEKQIEIIKPKAILCLGRIAATTLLNKNVALGKIREDVHEFRGIKLMATYHPAALMRNPGWKRSCWEDVQKFKKLVDELSGK